MSALGTWTSNPSALHLNAARALLSTDLRHRHGQDAVLEVRLHLLRIHREGQPQGALEGAVGALDEVKVLLVVRAFEFLLAPDGAPGAVPPVGACYGLDVIIDNTIAQQQELYFEGGDHATLVHVSGAEFVRLNPQAQHGSFSARD